MTEWLRVKNWREHQHYGKRRPPWIKLHRAMLEDYAVAQLPDSAKAHLVGIWLLAAGEDGRIPDDPAWVARKINATGPVDLNRFIDAGLLTLAHDASKGSESTLAPDRVETETEEETETETERNRDADAFAVLWGAYPRRPGDSKSGAHRTFLARRREGVPASAMIEGAKRYAAWCKKERTEAKYIKMAATFLGPGRHWESDYTSTAKPAQPVVTYPKIKAPPLEPGPAYVPVPEGEVDPRLSSIVGSIGRPMPKGAA